MTGREERLQEAIETVRSAGLDPDAPGGAAALTYLLGDVSSDPGERPRGEPDGDSAAPPILEISRWSGADAPLIEDIVEFSEEGAQLTLPSGRLPSAKADRQRVLTLMKLAFDRIGQGTDDVPARAINALMEEYACLDQNLAHNVAGNSTLITRRGKRGSYTYRVTQLGIDQAKELLGALLDGEDELRV